MNNNIKNFHVKSIEEAKARISGRNKAEIKKNTIKLTNLESNLQFMKNHLTNDENR